MESTSSDHVSIDVEELNSFPTPAHEGNLGISSVTRGASGGGLPISTMLRRPPPADTSQAQSNVAKEVIGLTFQAVLALFISTPTSYPPLFTRLFGAAMLISFAVSFAGLFLQNAFPGIALLFEKIGALLAGIGVYIIATLLLTHQSFSWIPSLGLGFFLMAFVLSFK